MKRLVAFYRFPLGLALGLRLALSAWLAAVWVVIEPYYPRSADALRETYGALSPSRSLLGRALFDVWLRWDAVHYLNLAHTGYTRANAADTNYMPLYPSVVAALKPLTLGREAPAALLVSTLGLMAAAVLFYRLVLDLFDDPELARWSVLVWAVYPTSFFLLAPFTESLYMALVLGSLVLLYRRRWLAGGALAALAGLARIQGSLLILPFLALIYQAWRAGGEWKPWRALGGLGLAAGGFLSFMAWRYAQGLAFLTDSFQQHSRIIFTDPLRGYLYAVSFAVRVGDYISVSEILSVSLFILITAWMALRPRFQAQPALLLYAVANLALFTSKQTLTASPLQSANRYVITLFPAFIGLAAGLLRLPPAWRRFLVSASLAGYLVLSALYALWIFIG
ncbi:MAG: mannosyltransferase family protein [Chloroflexota bacterium]